MKGDFIKIINGKTPVLVDFYAIWCGPCKAQSPIIKDLAQEVGGKVRIIKIDIDKNQAIAERYNVKGVPTLALFIFCRMLMGVSFLVFMLIVLVILLMPSIYCKLFSASLF